MGVIGVFVYAHNHRRNIDNPGNFGNSMKGRIRFMTAITPAYAHAYQLICLTRYIYSLGPKSAISRAGFQFQISAPRERE